MNASFEPLRLVNTYGAFGSVTRERYEVSIEGTSDENITEDTQWREYEFRGKPTDPKRRPPQWAPYHLRLDWLMWFIPLRPTYPPTWFLPFMEKLAARFPSVPFLCHHMAGARLSEGPDAPSLREVLASAALPTMPWATRLIMVTRSSLSQITMPSSIHSASNRT